MIFGEATSLLPLSFPDMVIVTFDYFLSFFFGTGFPFKNYLFFGGTGV